MRLVGDELDPGEEAALNSVVATWLMPPPTASSKRPLKICGAETKPFASVRLPSAPLSENTLPGRMIVPSSSVAARLMFVTRGAQQG